MITAILLAAGESRRMGQLKQLLPFGTKTVIETCLDALLASKADDVVVVLGHCADEIHARIEYLPITCVVNPDYQQGMSSSIKAGVCSVKADTQAVLIALVDQPLITSDIVDRLIDTHVREGATIGVPEFEGRSGHPILIDMIYRDEILAVDPQNGLREVIYRHWGDVSRLPVETDAIIQNMNTWDEYQRIVGQYAGAGREND
jgi:molybdenum cofactor cytidylyltransferase